jgi:hypothetical protein
VGRTLATARRPTKPLSGCSTPCSMRQCRFKTEVKRQKSAPRSIDSSRQFEPGSKHSERRSLPLKLLPPRQPFPLPRLPCPLELSPLSLYHLTSRRSFLNFNLTHKHTKHNFPEPLHPTVTTTLARYCYPSTPSLRSPSSRI